MDNEIAVQNVTKMAKGAGGEVSSEKLGEASFKVTVKMQGAPKNDSQEDPACTPDARSNTIVAVSYTHLDVYKRQPAAWVKAKQEISAPVCGSCGMNTAGRCPMILTPF